MKRIIIHCDLNNFFASVEGLKRPWLKNVPLAVAGDVEQRHGIILAKNIPASAFGIYTGEVLWSAKQKCPSLITVLPNFDDYIVISQKVRKIYEEYSDRVEAFGIDECWIDVSDIAKDFEAGKLIADEIRERIKSNIGITASCGVSFNKVFAKLASELKKPDGTSVVSEENFQSIVWPLPVEALLYVGRSCKKHLSVMNIHTIGELAQTDIKILELIFGKNGVSLWFNANGKDSTPVAHINIPTTVKSVSNSITLPKDITNDDDIRVVLYALCEKVSARLRRLDFVCSTVQIYVRDHSLSSYERQRSLEYPNRTVASLAQATFELFKGNHPQGLPVRSLGVHAMGLSHDIGEQLTINQHLQSWQKYESLDRATDTIRQKYGSLAIKRGIMLTETVMSGIEINEEKCSFAKI